MQLTFPATDPSPPILAPRLGQPLIPSRSLGPGSQGPSREHSRTHVCAHAHTLSPRKCMGTLTGCTGRHTRVWMPSASCPSVPSLTSPRLTSCSEGGAQRYRCGRKGSVGRTRGPGDSAPGTGG